MKTLPLKASKGTKGQPHEKDSWATAATVDAPDDAKHSPSEGELTPKNLPRRALAFREFLRVKLPPDVELLGRLILAGTIGLLYGLRGGGKSLLAMIIMYAIAGRKTVEPWGTGSGDTVCYLDGEMRAHGFRDRLVQLHAKNKKHDSIELALSNVRIISRNLFEDFLGTLDSVEGQESIEKMLPSNVRLIVIDNLSAWTGKGAEDINSWQIVKEWLIKLRLKGIAILLIHHAGKGGGQRGTSAHEDLMDYSIEVRPQHLEERPEATAFLVEHKKLRDQLPHLKTPYLFTVWQKDGAMEFTSVPVYEDSETQLHRILAMLKEGKNQTEIAAELGVHKSTVGRRLKDHNLVASLAPE